MSKLIVLEDDCSAENLDTLELYLEQHNIKYQFLSAEYIANLTPEQEQHIALLAGVDHVRENHTIGRV